MNILEPSDCPNKAVASRVASMKCVCSWPGSAEIVRFSFSVGKEKSALRVNSPGRNSAVLTTHGGRAMFSCRQHLARASHDNIAANNQIGAPSRDPDGVNIFRLLGEAHVAENGAAFLREARHIEHANAAAFEMRRHAENTADGYNAGSADARYDDVVGLLNCRQLRIGQYLQIAIGRDALALFQLGTVHGDELWGETLDSGNPLVAARLIDGALAAPFGLQRLHRHAVRFEASIAAAFADQFVDDDALVGIGKSVPLAAPALSWPHRLPS